MKLKAVIYYLLFLFICSSVSFAQDTLSYKSVLSKALDNNPLLKNESLNIDLAKSRYYNINNFFPKYPEADIEYETDKFFENKGNNLIAITLSQEIEIGGQLSLRKEVNNYRIKKAELDYKIRYYEIKYNVRTALNNAMIRQLKMEIANEIRSIDRELLDASERRLKAGDISELDYNLISIETNNSLMNYYKAEAEYKNELGKVNIYMGNDQSSMFYLYADDNYVPLTLSIDKLTKDALENRSDIRSKQLEQLANSSELSLFKAENIPNLKLSVGYSNSERVISGSDIIGVHNITKIMDNDKSIKFGVGFSIPLPFNGLFNTNRGNIQISEIRNNILINDIEFTKKQIRAEVVSALNRFESAKKSLDLIRENNFKIERTLELLHKGYEKGELSLINYLNERKKLYEMKINYLDVLEDYNQSVLDLEKVTQTNIN